MEIEESQSDDFISETVGLLILNELRLMRRDFKVGMVRLEQKVDLILDDSTETSKVNKSAKTKSGASGTKKAPAKASSQISGAEMKTLDFSNPGSSDDPPVSYTVRVDVNELPDDVSLESYDGDDEEKIMDVSDEKFFDALLKQSPTRLKKSLKKGLQNFDEENVSEQIFPLLENEDGRFQCSLCSNSFTKKGNLARHYRYHTNDKRYKCHVCSKRFVRQECLYSHARKHSSKELSGADPSEGYLINKNVGLYKNHTCSYCNRSFSLSTNLRRHIRLHTGEKPYSCKFCDEKFNRDDTLKRHVQKAHPDAV